MRMCGSDAVLVYFAEDPERGMEARLVRADRSADVYGQF